MNPLLSAYRSRFDKRFNQIANAALIIGLLTSIPIARFTYNALNGPFPLKSSDLGAIFLPDFNPKYFVSLQGKAIYSTSINWKAERRKTVSLQKDPVEPAAAETDGDYVLDLLDMDGHLVPVRTNDPSLGTKISGTIGALDPEVKALLRSEITSQAARLSILPVMLTETKTLSPDFKYWMLFAPFLLVVALSQFFKIFVLWKNFENHPLGKAIAKCGPYNTILQSLDDDLNSSGRNLTASNALIGKNWLLAQAKNYDPAFLVTNPYINSPHATVPILVPISEIVWTYLGNTSTPSIIQVPQNVPVLNSALTVCTASGAEIIFPLTAPASAELFEAIIERAPWAFKGDEGHKLSLRWNSQPKEVIGEALNRRDKTRRSL